MRLLYTLLTVVFFISIAGCQTEPSATDMSIIRHLNEINQNLSSINKQLKEIKEEVKDSNAPLPAVDASFNHQGPNLRRLKKIKLAKNPTKEQLETYIISIIQATKGQNTYSPRDIQIAMLSKVGSENIDLLFDYVQNYHVHNAISNIATQKDKKMILKALAAYPQLITCVIKNHWTKDAKEIIMTRLKRNTGSYLPVQWVEVAAQLASPKEYDILEKYFISSVNPEMTYKALNQLEGFDMKHAVAKAWAYQKNGVQPWTKKQMAMIAARFGHKDALTYLIKAYRVEVNQYSLNQMRTTIYQLLGEVFPPKKMTEWYKKNQANLVFNPKDERYSLGKKLKQK